MVLLDADPHPIHECSWFEHLSHPPPRSVRSWRSYLEKYPTEKTWFQPRAIDKIRKIKKKSNYRTLNRTFKENDKTEIFEWNMMERRIWDGNLEEMLKICRNLSWWMSHRISPNIFFFQKFKSSHFDPARLNPSQIRMFYGREFPWIPR